MGMPMMTAADLPVPVPGLTPVVGTASAGWAGVRVRIVFGLGVMVAVGLVTWLITDTLGSTTGTPPVAVDGLSAFAVFFVAALAVERLIEPLTMLDRKKPALELEEKKKATVVAEATSDVQARFKEAADAAAESEVWATYRAIGFWGLASVVGALAAALLNLHLLKTAGIRPPSLYLEILATGLIIGAGTKPLHELNKLVTAKKS